MPTSAQFALMSGFAAASALLWAEDPMLAPLGLAVMFALLGFAALLFESVQLCREICDLVERLNPAAKGRRVRAIKRPAAKDRRND